MAIRNVSYDRIDTVTIGGAGNGNSYNFTTTYEVEVGPKGSDVWTEITTMAHGERDVASSFEYAGQEVPAELRGPYDCYGRRTAEAEAAHNLLVGGEFPIAD